MIIQNLKRQITPCDNSLCDNDIKL